MAWTAPATWSTGQIVTAAELNEQVRDNEIYLKAEADRLDAQTFTSTAKVFNTIYQNTTSQIRFVGVVVECDNQGYATFRTNSASPPTTLVGAVMLTTVTSTDRIRGTMTAIVFPDWYYTVSSAGGTPTLNLWNEWGLL